MSVYRGNRRATLGLAFLAFMAFSVALGTRPGDPALARGVQIVAGSAICLASCVAIAWVFSINLVLTSDGLQYQSFFGRRTLFWEEIEYAWFSVVSYSIHGLPLGTQRTVTLAPRDGPRFVFGNRIARTDAMMAEIAQLTLPYLYAWMIAALNTGRLLDLGGVRLSRLSGLEMKGLLGYASLGLDEIERYEVDGDFAVWVKGARMPRKVRADSVANVHALRAVLDALLKAPVSRGAAPYACCSGPG